MMISSNEKSLLSSKDLKTVMLCEAASPIGDCSVGLPPHGYLPTDVAKGAVFWFPTGTPRGHSVAIASSRMSQKFDEHIEWFDALRTAAVQISQADQFLITAKGTTVDPFLKRLAELFGIPLLEFERFPTNPANRWFAEQSNMPATPEGPAKCFYQPLESLSGSVLNINEILNGSAQTVFLLSVRKNGNVFSSIRSRLSNLQQSSTRLLMNPGLTTKGVQAELRSAGATAWWIYNQDSNESAIQNPARPKIATVLSLDEINSDNYLAHWTRRRVGPWPGQPQAEYLDDLIFQTSRRGHNEVSSLCRILASQRIVGSSELTRDIRDVVCFSDLPLDELLQHRVFRPHLSRWDFEPYGIAIERDWLKQMGARPVNYGTESTWAKTPESERAFFQLANSKASNIDWSIEREWRIIGDLRLQDIPVNRAVVFVKTPTDAELVAELSRWPIVILG